MDRFLSRNAVRIVSFIVIFLSFEVAFCGNDTIPSAPQTAEEWFEKGRASFDNEDYAEAVECYNKSIELSPNDALAYYNLGLAYDVGGQDYDKAIECHKRAIVLDLDFPLIYYNLGVVYLEGKQNYEKAIECFEKAVALAKLFANAYFNLGAAYQVGRQDYDKAIECYEKVIDLDPDFAEVYFNLGTAYQEQGNEEKATKYYKEAARLGHERFATMVTRGKYPVGRKPQILLKNR